MKVRMVMFSWFLLSCVAMIGLVSCAGTPLAPLNPFNWFDDPASQEMVVKAGSQLFSGEVYGAAYTVGSWIIYKLGLGTYKRVKGSGPGTMGIVTPPPTTT